MIWWPYFIAAGAAFITTFLRSVQNKNVAAGFKTLSFLCGATMAAMDGLVIVMVAKSGLAVLPASALGAGLGWVCGMVVFDKLTAKRRAELKRIKKAKRELRYARAIREHAQAIWLNGSKPEE